MAKNVFWEDTVTLIFDLWFTKCNQFILESKWKFVPNEIKFPPDGPETSCWQEWDWCEVMVTLILWPLTPNSYHVTSEFKCIMSLALGWTWYIASEKWMDGPENTIQPQPSPAQSWKDNLGCSVTFTWEQWGQQYCLSMRAGRHWQLRYLAGQHFLPKSKLLPVFKPIPSIQTPDNI